jgi:O-antigen/teichoic acid export membrane protein
MTCNARTLPVAALAMRFRQKIPLSTTDLLYFLSVIGQKSFVFVTSLLLAHALSPTDFGALTIMITAALLLSALSTAWLTSATYRFAADPEVANQKENVDAIMSAYSLALLIGTAILLLMNSIWLGMEKSVIAAAIFLAITLSCSDILGAAMNAQQMPKSYLSIAMLRTGSTLAIVIVSILCDWGLIGAALAYLVGGAATFLLPAARAFVRETRLRLPDAARLRKFVWYGIPAGVAFNNYILVYGVVRLILARTHGAGSVGRFALASDLFAAPTTLVLGTFVLSYMPLMHRGWFENGDTGARPWAEKFLFSQLAFAIPIAIGGLVLGDIAWLLLAPGARDAGELGLAAFCTFNGVGLGLIGSCSTVLISMNRPWAAFSFTVSTVIMSGAAALISADSSSLVITAEATCVAIAANVFSVFIYTLNVSGVRIKIARFMYIAAIATVAFLSCLGIRMTLIFALDFLGFREILS